MKFLEMSEIVKAHLSKLAISEHAQKHSVFDEAGIVILVALLFSVIVFVRNYNENIVGLAGDLVQ